MSEYYIYVNTILLIEQGVSDVNVGGGGLFSPSGEKIKKKLES